MEKTDEKLIEIMNECNAAGMDDQETADYLNAEGKTTVRGLPWTRDNVYWHRKKKHEKKAGLVPVDTRTTITREVMHRLYIEEGRTTKEISRWLNRNKIFSTYGKKFNPANVNQTLNRYGLKTVNRRDARENHVPEKEVSPMPRPYREQIATPMVRSLNVAPSIVPNETAQLPKSALLQGVLNSNMAESHKMALAKLLVE